MTKNTVRVDELAKEWKVAPRTIRREISRGTLRAFKVGDTWRIKVDEAEKYVDHHAAKKKMDCV